MNIVYLCQHVIDNILNKYGDELLLDLDGKFFEHNYVFWNAYKIIIRQTTDIHVCKKSYIQKKIILVFTLRIIII